MEPVARVTAIRAHLHTTGVDSVMPPATEQVTGSDGPNARAIRLGQLGGTNNTDSTLLKEQHMFFSAIDANTARAIAEAVNDRLTEKTTDEQQ